MKRKRLRSWVKTLLASILVAIVIGGGLTILSLRYNQLCKNGYNDYCPVIEK